MHVLFKDTSLRKIIQCVGVDGGPGLRLEQMNIVIWSREGSIGVEMREGFRFFDLMATCS